MLLAKIDLNDFKDVFCYDNETDIGFSSDNSDDLKNIAEKITITEKTKSTINLIDRLVNDEKKTVIVWCIFVKSMEMLKDYLDEMAIKAEIIYGSTPSDRRNEILTLFKSKKLQVLITNPQTMAESISLHSVCHDAIYFEYSYNLTHLLQSKDRIHRLGLSKNQYTQYYFVCNYYGNFSLDKNIYERLIEKEKNMLDAIDNNELEDVYALQDDIDFCLKDLK